MSRWRRQQRKRAGKQRRLSAGGRWVIYRPGEPSPVRAMWAKALREALLAGKVTLLPHGCAVDLVGKVGG